MLLKLLVIRSNKRRVAFIHRICYCIHVDGELYFYFLKRDKSEELGE